jgi:uncharacterized protein YndB with AHSA1/START domain
MTIDKSGKSLLTQPSDREIRVERIFDAPRDRVWKAYTDPELVAQWWGRGNKVVVEKLELVRGGHWRFVEHAGGESHGFEGRIAEIDPPERIVQTFEWDGMPGHVSLQTATFHDIGGGRTRMVSVSIFMTAEDCAGMFESGMESGMNESFAALDRLLAR